MSCACRLVGGLRRHPLSARSASSLQFDEKGAKEDITWAKNSTTSAAIRVPSTKNRKEHPNTGLGTARRKIVREKCSLQRRSTVHHDATMLDSQREMIPSVLSKVAQVREKSVQ